MGDEPVKIERDYTGVSTAELARVFQRHLGIEKLAAVAERLGMDIRDLKKIVENPKGTFTGLQVADRVFLAIGQNVSTLSYSGEIKVVPRKEKNAAERMALDEFWVQDIEPTPEQLAQRVEELVSLREKVLV